MIFLKRGVKLQGPAKVNLHPIWHEYALEEIEAVFVQYGSPCVITSAWEGKHRPDSLHYMGRALDFRTRTVKKSLRVALTVDIDDVLGIGWDVIFEGDHLHVEYDPR